MNSDMVLSLVIPNLKVVMHQSIEATIEKVKKKHKQFPYGIKAISFKLKPIYMHIWLVKSAFKLQISDKWSSNMILMLDAHTTPNNTSYKNSIVHRRYFTIFDH